MLVISSVSIVGGMLQPSTMNGQIKSAQLTALPQIILRMMIRGSVKHVTLPVMDVLGGGSWDASLASGQRELSTIDGPRITSARPAVM